MPVQVKTATKDVIEIKFLGQTEKQGNRYRLRLGGWDSTYPEPDEGNGTERYLEILIEQFYQEHGATAPASFEIKQLKDTYIAFATS